MGACPRLLEPATAQRGTTPRSAGASEWQLEFATPSPTPGPVITVARRLCHLVSGQILCHDYTFGGKALTMDMIVFPATAAAALAWMEQSHDTFMGRALGHARASDQLTIKRHAMYGVPAAPRRASDGFLPARPPASFPLPTAQVHLRDH